MKVLLVGASDDARGRLEALLRAHGHDVVAAGADPTSALTQGRPDLVLTVAGESDGVPRELAATAWRSGIPCVGFPLGNGALADSSHVVAGLVGTIAELTAALQARAGPASERRAALQQRMLGSVAHEFNNVLAAVLTCAGAFCDLTPVRDGAELLAELETGAQRAQAVAKRLVALARGRGEAPRPQPLAAYLAELPSALRAALPVDVVLVVDVAGAERTTATVSATVLFQALFQLVMWTLDGLPTATGQVTLRLTQHHQLGRFEANLGLLADGDFAQITVEHDQPSASAAASPDDVLIADVQALRGAVVFEKSPTGGRVAKLFLPAER